MRRFTRGCLKTAAVFAAIGGAFCIAGFCLGFESSELQRAIESGKNQVIKDEWISNIDLGGEMHSFAEEYSDIDTLKLDGVLNCRLIPYGGTVWKVTGSAVPMGFQVKQNGKTLKISNTGKKFWIFGETESGEELEIYIPKTVTLDELALDLDVGDVEMPEDSYLTCKKVEIDCGVGSCALNLNVTKKVKIDCGVGDVALNLQGKESDFDYDLECGAGTLLYGKNEYSGLGTEQERNGSAQKEIKAECGVGSVSIQFEQES